MIQTCFSYQHLLLKPSLYFSPIALVMLANIYMFAYSSFKLYRMQKNIRSHGKNAPYKVQNSKKYSVKYANASTKSCLEQNPSRIYPRIDSGTEGDGSETDIQGFSDTCHSPNEGEVFSTNSSKGYGVRAKKYARNLSTKIPTAKFSRQLSKFNSHKDR